MFYTLISKLPFMANDKSPRKIFKIFVIGSIFYALLHYYLYSSEFSGLLGKAKSYLYYVMAADFAVAYVLTKFFGPTTDESSIDNTEHYDSYKRHLDMASRSHDIEELRKLQMSKHSVQELPQSPFVIKQDSDDEKETKEKKEDKDSDRKESKSRKSSDRAADTTLPVYRAKSTK